MNLPFRPATGVRVYQDIVEQIQDAIFSGQLKVGQKLPSERELQKILQASRPTVREAIRVIEDRGLIQIKLGRDGGVFIKSDKIETLSDNFDLLIRSEKFSLDHLAEFREKLEGEIVQIAASKSNDSDINQLEELITDAKICSSRAKRSIRKFIEIDTRFHLKLSMITGNTIYIYMLNSIYNLNSYFGRFFKIKDDLMEENLQDLIDIVNAVSDRRSSEAKKMSINHIRKFNQNY